MNSIRVLLNAVKGSKLKVSITMNNGITYRCYVTGCIDNDKFLVSRKYEDETCNTIDVNRIGRVVIRATHQL